MFSNYVKLTAVFNELEKEIRNKSDVKKRIAYYNKCYENKSGLLSTIEQRQRWKNFVKKYHELMNNYLTEPPNNISIRPFLSELKIQKLTTIISSFEANIDNWNEIKKTFKYYHHCYETSKGLFAENQNNILWEQFIEKYKNKLIIPPRLFKRRRLDPTLDDISKINEMIPINNISILQGITEMNADCLEFNKNVFEDDEPKQ